MGENGVTRWFSRWRNRNRARAYAEALVEWEEACRLIDVMLSNATPGAEPFKTHVGTRLRPGEFLLYELWNVALVETRQFPAETVSHQVNVGLRTPLTVGFGTSRTVPTPPVDESVVLDVGSVAISDQRVTFAGPKYTREWPLDELIRPVYDQANCTIYLPVSSRGETSGFRYPPPLVWAATAHLDLALARHSGDWEIVDTWRAAREDLEARRPQLPSGADIDADTIERARTALHGERPAATSMRPATLVGRRFLARLIDVLAGGVVFGFLAYLFGTSSSDTYAALFATALVYEALPIARRGGSIGKRRLCLAVVDRRTGDRPSSWQALVRSFVLAASVVTVIGPIVQLVRLLGHATEYSLHDRLAGTEVVATR
jgi:uncharacterized RDD family membrane protein YckC